MKVLFFTFCFFSFLVTKLVQNSIFKYYLQGINGDTISFNLPLDGRFSGSPKLKRNNIFTKESKDFSFRSKIQKKRILIFFSSEDVYNEEILQTVIRKNEKVLTKKYIQNPKQDSLWKNYLEVETLLNNKKIKYYLLVFNVKEKKYSCFFRFENLDINFDDFVESLKCN